MKATSTAKSTESTKKNIVVKVQDQELGKSEQFSMTMSHHSAERIEQRSISQRAIEIALLHGVVFFKQGLQFYVMGENNLPDNINPQVRKKCKNLILVISGDTSEIITTYRNKNPFRYVKKKSKQLSRNAA